MKYIDRVKFSFHIDWRDDEDDSFNEHEVIEDVDLGFDKNIDWLLDDIEQQKNADEGWASHYEAEEERPMFYEDEEEDIK
jgi:hypothetical protein